jgi:hypothetical protein
MRDGLGDLGLSQAIVHPDRDMAGQLRDLTVGGQSADRDQAAFFGLSARRRPELAARRRRISAGIVRR